MNVADQPLTAKRKGTAGYAVGFWLLVLVGVGVEQRWLNRVLRKLPNQPVVLAHPLADIPRTIGSWQGADIAVDSRVMEVTGADDHIARRYVNTINHGLVDVFVAYTSRPFTMIGHHPDKCYPANGWTGQGAKTVALERENGGYLECRIYYFSREDAFWEGRVVLNYFVLQGKHTVDAEEFSGPQWRLPNVGRDPSYYVAQVQIVAVVREAGEYERAEKAVEQFAIAAADDVDALLPLTGAEHFNLQSVSAIPEREGPH